MAKSTSKYRLCSGAVHRSLTLACLSASALLPGCSSSGGGSKADSVGESRSALQAPGDGESAQKQSHYTLFEAGASRPIAILRGGLVAVANIPDDRVELF